MIGEFNRGCGPIIGVDGAHLKGHFIGVLLTAIDIHAANYCVPLEVVVMESKNNDSWTYFFNALAHVVGAKQYSKFTIILGKCKVIELSNLSIMTFFNSW